eukprot:4756633-Prymnesium_polylepis.1
MIFCALPSSTLTSPGLICRSGAQCRGCVFVLPDLWAPDLKRLRTPDVRCGTWLRVCARMRVHMHAPCPACEPPAGHTVTGLQGSCGERRAGRRKGGQGRERVGRRAGGWCAVGGARGVPGRGCTHPHYDLTHVAELLAEGGEQVFYTSSLRGAQQHGVAGVRGARERTVGAAAVWLIHIPVTAVVLDDELLWAARSAHQSAAHTDVVRSHNGKPPAAARRTKPSAPRRPAAGSSTTRSRAAPRPRRPCGDHRRRLCWGSLPSSHRWQAGEKNLPF